MSLVTERLRVGETSLRNTLSYPHALMELYNSLSATANRPRRWFKYRLHPWRHTHTRSLQTTRRSFKNSECVLWNRRVNPSACYKVIASENSHCLSWTFNNVSKITAASLFKAILYQTPRHRIKKPCNLCISDVTSHCLRNNGRTGEGTEWCAVP